MGQSFVEISKIGIRVPDCSLDPPPLEYRGVYSSHLAEKVPAKKLRVINVFPKSSLEIHEEYLKCPGNLAFIDVFQKSSPKIHKNAQHAM